MKTEPTQRQEDPGIAPLRPRPRPVPGCPECARLAQLRKAAEVESGQTTSTDCDILMRMHGTGH